MRLISLTRNQKTKVDCENFLKFSQFKWYARRSSSGKFYAVRAIYPKNKQKIVYMHRLVIKAPDGLEVDHINGDTLDNRKSNLRLCTNAENLRNQSKHRRNKSGFKGVVRNGNNWQAKIRVNNKTIYLGTFKTPVEAAKKYDEYVIKYHGEFARLNFPKGL